MLGLTVECHSKKKKIKALFEREQFAKQMGAATIVIGLVVVFFFRRRGSLEDRGVWTLLVETQRRNDFFFC